MKASMPERTNRPRSPAVTLDSEQLFELTKRKRPHAQRRVLDAIGVRYRVRPDNSLVVLTCELMQTPEGAPGTIRMREPELRI